MKRTVITRLVLVLLVLAGAAVAGVMYQESYQRGQYIEAGRQLSLSQPLPLPALSAVDSDGRAVGLDMFRGYWSVLFFGYMHCPDVCTPTMQQLSLMLSSVPGMEFSAPVQAVFVRVDGSGADGHESLAEYVGRFHSAVRGINFMPPELKASLGVWVQPVEGNLYDHSTSLFVVSPDAQLYAVLTSPHVGTVISSSLHKIDAFYVEEG